MNGPYEKTVTILFEKVNPMSHKLWVDHRSKLYSMIYKYAKLVFFKGVNEEFGETDKSCYVFDILSPHAELLFDDLMEFAAQNGLLITWIEHEVQSEILD